MDITDNFFRKRLVEILLGAISKQLLIHNELWEGINAIKKKYSHHPEIGSLFSAQFENIFSKMFHFISLSFSPTSIIKNLRQCHLYLQLSIEANAQINFRTPIEETSFYPALKEFLGHNDLDLRYQAAMILQALFFLQCNRSAADHLSSSHAKMTAQFSFGNQKVIRKRETLLALGKTIKEKIASSIASAGFTTEFIAKHLPQINLGINEENRLHYHKAYSGEFIYESCHYMDLLLPQIEDFFTEDFLSNSANEYDHSQSLLEQLYLLEFAVKKIEEEDNLRYSLLVAHICRSPAFDPEVRCRAIYALFQYKLGSQISLVEKYFANEAKKSTKESLISIIYFALKTDTLDAESVKLLQDSANARNYPNTVIAVTNLLNKCITADFNHGMANITLNIRKNLNKKHKDKLQHPSFQVNYYPRQKEPESANDLFGSHLLREAVLNKDMQNFIADALKDAGEELQTKTEESASTAGSWFINNHPVTENSPEESAHLSQVL
ncbi:hypothetical protein Lbir_2063 [Legionella birminghamensis]|uniref:Uncharacterized protein n=2 Tax=Legionella birminghamensis TaxID=28083 RepID=A0A378I9T0_9GAMM|nr:hypothetical protein [Legionella birminghamensis]KTC69324.1 hypothetical protein Lbir_2063 [Legionella birminghamensis]STX31586.1 Uncharacterised protein [Legionella birminghamensis]